MTKNFKNTIALIAWGILLKGNLFAQNVFYSENFNAGGLNWTTTPISENFTGGNNGSTPNNWFINTPNANVINGSSSLHISCSDILCSIIGGGPNNPIYNESGPANATDKISFSQPITTPSTGVITLKFNWLCYPDESLFGDYGSVYYRLNPTSNWILLSNLEGQSSVQNFSQVLPSSVNGLNTFQIGFRWINNGDGLGQDPAINIDDITLETPALSNTVTTNPVAASPLCGIKTFNLSFTSSGTFDTGNTFTVQLSDANGSFSNLVTIGSGNASPIACVIPDGTVSGSGYFVRVVASAPSAIGSASALSYFVTPTLSTSSTPTNCGTSPSGSVSVTASGGAAATAYSWSTNPVATTQTVNNLSSGTYYVTVTYGTGCTVTDSATVSATGITLASSTVLGQTSENPPNGTISIGVAGGQAPYTYLWNTTPPSTLNTVEGLTSGNYTCTVTDATGCSVVFTFNVPNTVGLKEIDESTFDISPNPANDFITISKLNEIVEDFSLTMFDAQGKEFFSRNNIVTKNSIKLDVSEYPNGIYFLQLKNNKVLLNKKFIKQ
jgi:hypothetical protein